MKWRNGGVRVGAAAVAALAVFAAILGTIPLTKPAGAEIFPQPIRMSQLPQWVQNFPGDRSLAEQQRWFDAEFAVLPQNRP